MLSSRAGAIAAVILLLAASGCVGEVIEGAVPRGSRDAGASHGLDAGARDAGATLDAGVTTVVDAGPLEVDAGPVELDAGSTELDAGPTLVDDAQIASDTFPAQLACSASQSATVTVLNAGTSTWTKTSGFALVAVGGADPLATVARVDLDDGESVPPGATRDFTLPLAAPTSASTVTTSWQMVHDGVGAFGAAMSHDVTVSCTGQTPFDLSQVVIQASPDVRGFAVTSTITSLQFSPGTIQIDHTMRGQWPPVQIDPDGTTQEATIWVFFCIGGTWYGTGGERLRPNQTDKALDEPSEIGADWLYDSNRWGSMTNYVPQVGELVGFMVVAGSTRSDDNVIVQERSGVVLIPFPADGVTTAYPPFNWQE